MKIIDKAIATTSGMLLLLALTPAVAAQDSAQRCFEVFANIDARFATTGCTSPVGLCTAGTLAGFPGGTTHFVALGLGGAPVGEASIVTPPAEPGSTWSYRGDLVYTTPVGELRLEDVGVLDTARGTYTELQRVTSGTGSFDGATGDLFSYGHTTPAGDGFVGAVRGSVCVPRTHGHHHGHDHD
jgi:hypothetical protein